MESATVDAKQPRIGGVPLEQYRRAFEHSPHPMWVFDVDTLAFIDVNNAAIAHYGYSRDEFMAMTVSDIHQLDELRPLDRRRAARDHANGSPGVWRHRTRNGSLIDVELSSHELAFEGRRARVVLASDVTARQRAENAQLAQLAVARSLAEATTVEDASASVLQALGTTLGWDAAELWTLDRGASVLRLQASWTRPSGDGVAYTHSEHRAAAVPVLSGEDRLGVLEFLALTPRDVDDALVQTLTIASSQLGQFVTRKQAEQELAHQALHDPLTGLPNRTLLLDWLEVALAHSRRHDTSVAVLFLDIDNFKLINDSLGHRAGDELLCSVADRIRHVLGPTDTVARFGGDEFVVIADQIERAQDAIALAQRINSMFSSSFPLEDGEQVASTSIGIALASGSTQKAEDMLRDADAAMYRAKARGRGRYEVFDEVMQPRMLGRLRTENDLRAALRSDELGVFYQPIVELDGGRVAGVEALVRWQHPERGLLTPGDFISVAEDSGLILPIGTWVLTEACRRAAALQRRCGGGQLFVSVNVSPTQIVRGSLEEHVATALGETGVEPGLLKLELTENALIDAPDSLGETLEKLKALGVSLVLDDFGTGYSALGYLSRFPIDVLKLDRSFVARIGAGPRHSAIVQAVLDMARALGIEVVAKGVETSAQADHLRRLGCEYAQGFYFSAATAVEDLRALLSVGGLPFADAQVEGAVSPARSRGGRRWPRMFGRPLVPSSTQST
jgi:diguanylate cyclase (GGDEF)-like protein/PAS domain S-box-containing protein